MNKAYKLVSLFDGSGGFPLAGSMCGIIPVGAAEVEPYPIAVTKSRFPGMKHLGDITKINGAEIEPVDIITFGSPCQDLSVAGKRAGLKHEDNGDEETTRSGLFMEAVRIIKEMREATNGMYPTFALWENVPGAFSSNRGEDFRTVLEELIRIVEPTAAVPEVPPKGWAYADCYCGDGWSLAYRTLDAQYWGVPQRRRRIYLVLDFGGERAGKILFEREGLRGYFAKGRTPWQGTAADAQRCTGADDRAGEGNAVGFDGYNGDTTGDKCATLGVNCGLSTGRNGVAVPVYSMKSIARNGKALTEQANPICASDYKDPDIVAVPICMATQQGGAEIRTDDKAPTITAAAGMSGNNQPVVCYDAQGNGDGAVCNTITGDHENRVTDYTSVVVEPCPIHDQATRFSGKRGDKSDGKGNGLGIGEPGDPMNTLTSGDRHAVCYAETYQKVTGSLMANSHPGSYCGQDAYQDMLVVGKVRETDKSPIVLDRAFFNQGQNAKYDPQFYTDGTCPTLVARGPSAVAHKEAICYIVRRLTPTECARLQGFPDEWGHPDTKEDLTDEEHRFWRGVRKTYDEIQANDDIDVAKRVIAEEESKEHPDLIAIEEQRKIIEQAESKKTRSYTKAQTLKWYNKLHTDSAEYKMWGNGIALPTALYVMQGIAEELEGAE